jgi:hypothetical protein
MGYAMVEAGFEATRAYAQWCLKLTPFLTYRASDICFKFDLQLAWKTKITILLWLLLLLYFLS